MDETMYSIKDVAKLLRLSPQTVTKIFEHEPGVIVLPGGGPKRSYRSFRIPKGVFERVLRKYRQ
jgi:hypothetical protein